MAPSLKPLYELSADSALTMLQAAKKKAEQLGINACISVVGPQGIPLASIRMNCAPLLSASLAEDKAYTAVSFNRATHEWDDHLALQPKVQQALAKRDRFTMLGGGLPINLPAEPPQSPAADTHLPTQSALLVGAIGVSGGSVHQDIECAQAAIAVLGMKCTPVDENH